MELVCAVNFINLPHLHRKKQPCKELFIRGKPYLLAGSDARKSAMHATVFLFWKVKLLLPKGT